MRVFCVIIFDQCHFFWGMRYVSMNCIHPFSDLKNRKEPTLAFSISRIEKSQPWHLKIITCMVYGLEILCATSAVLCIFSVNIF